MDLVALVIAAFVYEHNLSCLLSMMHGFDGCSYCSRLTVIHSLVIHSRLSSDLNINLHFPLVVFHGCFIPVDLRRVEVQSYPTFDLLADFRGLSRCIILMFILLNAIGSPSEDQILSEILSILFIIDVLDANSCTDILGAVLPGFHQLTQIVFHVFIRPAVALNSFHTKVCVVLVGVEDLQRIHVHVLACNTIHVFVNRLDLGIFQVEIAGKAVAGDGVGAVQGSARDRIRQIDPQKIALPEFCFIPYSDPFLSRYAGTVLYHLVFSNWIIVDFRVVIEHCGEVDGFQLWDILPISCDACRSIVHSGQCG